MSDNPKNDIEVDWAKEMSFDGNGVVTMRPSGPTDFGVGKNIATFEDAIGGCNMSFRDTAARGYMYKPDDARDLEITMEMNFSGINSGFSTSVRTGHHSSDGCCQGCALMLNLEPSTSPIEFRWRKEVTHPHYASLPYFTKSGISFKANGYGWFGLKFISYNKTVDNEVQVVLEGYVNPTPDTDKTNWILIGTQLDKPNSGWGDGNGGTSCDGDDDQVISWSGAQNRFKSNSTSGSIKFRAVSLREIDPSKSFDDPDGGTGGGTGGGGGGSGGGGGGTGGGANIIQPVITYGIISASTGPYNQLILNDFPSFDSYDSISRALSEELIESQVDPDPNGLFGSAGWQSNDPAEPDIGDRPCDFDVASGHLFQYPDGLIVEDYWANDLNRCVAVGRGDTAASGAPSTKIKFKGGRVMQRPHVKLIFVGSDWDSRSSAPTKANVITMIQTSLLDTNKQYFSKLNQYGGCGTPVWDEAVTNTTYTLASGTNRTVVEGEAIIKDSLESDLIHITSTDFTNTWFCVIMPVNHKLLDGNTNTIAVGGWHCNYKPTLIIPTGSGNSGGGGPPPVDTTTITGIFKLQADINQTHVSGCQGTDDTGSGGGSTKIYEVTDTSSNEKSMGDDPPAGNRTRMTIKVNSSSAPIKTQIPKQFDVPLKRSSTAPSASPVVSAKIWDSNDNVVYTSSTTFDPSTFTTSYVTKVFNFSSNTHALVQGDKIGVEYTGGDSSKYITIAYVTTDSGNVGTTGTYVAQYESGSYDNQTSRRLTATIWI